MLPTTQVIELLEAAEAKAYYGMAINWKPLEALSKALLERGVLQGKEVRGACCCWDAAEMLLRCCNDAATWLQHGCYMGATWQ